MACLVLLNGAPASGKSTLAAMFVQRHPLALDLDLDDIRRLLGRWTEQPRDAGLATRALALAMADVHLRSGRHVVVPQFLGRIEFIEQLEAVAQRAGAQFLEVALMTSRDDTIRWFAERSSAPETDAHIDAAALVALVDNADPVGQMYDAFVRTIEARPNTRRVLVLRGDVDATFNMLVAALEMGTP